MKYIFGLMAESFDVSGARAMVQHPGSIMSNLTRSRRVSRTATLDGGADLYDTGYSDSDRTLTFATDISHFDFLTHLVESYETILVSTDDGLFRGCPESCRVRGNNAEINILVSEGL